MDRQYSAIVKHWTMLYVQNVQSTSGYNSCPQPKSPPINRLISDRLSFNQTLTELINMSHIDRPTPVALPIL